MHFLGLLRARRLAGTDGPDGLVRDDRASERGDTGQIEHGIQLAVHHFKSAPGLAFGKLFADAQDRCEARREYRGEFARHQLIGLTEQGATLGMTHDGAGTADVLEHGRGHFAGEGALGLGADVLCAQVDARAGQRAMRLGQVKERRAHPDLGRGIRQLVHDGFEQRGVLRARAVHLPITGDDLAA